MDSTRKQGLELRAIGIAVLLMAVLSVFYIVDRENVRNRDQNRLNENLVRIEVDHMLLHRTLVQLSTAKTIAEQQDILRHYGEEASTLAKIHPNPCVSPTSLGLSGSVASPPSPIPQEKR